jgi:hypothetical protein
VQSPGAAEPNLYAYVDGKPLKAVDPTGLFAFAPMLAGAIGGGVVDAVVQGAEIYMDRNKTYKDFSFARTAVSAGAGALGVGLGAKTGQLLQLVMKSKTMATIFGGVVGGAVSGQAGSLAKKQGFEAIQSAAGLEGTKWFAPSGTGPSVSGAAIDGATSGAGAALGMAVSALHLREAGTAMKEAVATHPLPPRCLNDPASAFLERWILADRVAKETAHASAKDAGIGTFGSGFMSTIWGWVQSGSTSGSSPSGTPAGQAQSSAPNNSSAPPVPSPPSSDPVLDRGVQQDKGNSLFNYSW